jgi:hypothetical protein
VQADKNIYHLGVITKLFNLDSKSHLINGITFDRAAWQFVPRGSYYFRHYIENLDHAELLEDNYIKPNSEAYFKKLLPVQIDMIINGGDTPEFKIWGRWNLIFGEAAVQIETPFYSVYAAAISQQDWDDMLKPKSKIDVSNLDYKQLGDAPTQ